MVTARQLREALRLAELQPADIAARARIGPKPILDGLAGAEPLRLSSVDETLLRTALGEAGIMILPEHRDDLGVRKLPASVGLRPRKRRRTA